MKNIIFLLLGTIAIFNPSIVVSQTLSSSSFEVGGRIGISLPMKINKLGGSDNAKFSSNVNFTGGIEATFLKRLFNHFSIGSAVGLGMFPTHTKVKFDETEYFKAHPRTTKKVSFSEDNLYADLGLVLSYQGHLQKQKYIRVDVTPKIHLTTYPGGDSGLELIEPDSSVQNVYNIDYSKYKREQFKVGCNISVNYLSERKRYFFIGLFASIVPSSFKGDYVLFPGTAYDYAYGNIAVRLSTFGIKAGFGFKHFKK